MKKINLFIIILIILLGSCNQDKVKQEITTEELHETIEFLASDSLKGRYPGTDEDLVAAEYIRNKFQDAGLEVLFHEGLQQIEIINKIQLGSENILKTGERSYSAEESFIPFPFSAIGDYSGKVAFVGYGFKIEEDTIQWNDYKDLDVKDKMVMILRGDPELDNPVSGFIPYSDDYSKVLLAKEMGAAGVILVSGINFDKEDDLIGLDVPQRNVSIPVIQVKRKVAEDILQDQKIETLEKQLNKERKPFSYLTNTEVNIKVDLEIKKQYSYNIAGILKSQQPTDEYIVIGAHYDHLGFGGSGTGSRVPDTTVIHNGADDNASGISAMIEIAENLSFLKDSLKRNIIFVAFGAEEMGLIGSKYFVKHSSVDVKNIVAMINLDMIGRLRNKTLQVGGTGTSLGSESLLNEINRNYQFNLTFSREGYGPSDHSSFYGKDIPVFFFSTGAHIDYHTHRDTLGKINFEGLQTVTRYASDLAFSLSASDSTLTFQEAGPKMNERKYGHKSRMNVSLGIMPDFAGIEKAGLRADLVIKGKPAYKAGMKDGDIIIAIDGKEVKDIYSYMSRLSKLKPGDIITVEVLRDDQKEVLIVNL